jgi:hypothetical protein
VRLLSLSAVAAAAIAALGACSGAPGAAADLQAPPDLTTVDLAFPTAPHPSWPQYTSADGVLLKPLTLVSIVAQNDAVGSKFLDFGDALAKSAWWTTVGQETMTGPVTNVRVTGPAITTNVKETDIQAYVTALVNAKTAPAPNGNTFYLLYLPDGVWSINAAGVVNTDCSSYEGIHFNYTATDNWGIALRCFHNTQAGIDDATNTASHEVIEAATDPTQSGWLLDPPPTPPQTGSVWSSFGGGSPVELADLCTGSVWTEGGWQYQRVYSDPAAAGGGDPCVPAIPNPFFSVAPAQAWTAVAAGQKVDITLTGWSTGAMSDWYLDWLELTATGGKWAETVTGSRTFHTNNFDFAAVNNGTTATLSVTAPAGAASGSWDLVYIYSTPEKATDTPDLYHIMPIGIYVQ